MFVSICGVNKKAETCLPGKMMAWQRDRGRSRTTTTRITLAKCRGRIREQDGSSGSGSMGGYASDAGVGAKNGRSCGESHVGVVV